MTDRPNLPDDESRELYDLAADPWELRNLRGLLVASKQFWRRVSPPP